MMWYDSRAIRRREQEKSWKAQEQAEGEQRALPPEWAVELQRSIVGTVVLPGDPAYNKDRMLSNPRFSAFPQVIVYCETESDVAECLKVAGKVNLSVVVRSGGHSTGGFSSQDGFLIDVSRMNDVVVDADRLTAWVGPGTDFRKLNSKLEFHDLHLPGGACPDVCVGGFMQGGGYGFTARIFGMNCDHVLAVRVMLADGSLVYADAETNRDLFWAVRGGTGSNFGVLLDIKYRLHRGKTFTGFSIYWSLEGDEAAKNGANAQAWLQENFMRGQEVPDLGYQMIWAFQGPGEGPKVPLLLMRGIYRGSVEALKHALRPVLDLPGATLQQIYDPQPYSDLNRFLLTKPYEVPEFPEDMTPMPPPEAKLSRYLSRPIDAAGWLSMIEYFRKSPSPYTIAAMEIYGGAIERAPHDGNAFLHRDVYCDLFFDVFWLNELEEKQVMSFLEGWKALVQPFWDGGVYQNYPSPHDPAFGENYWGDLYVILRAIKAKYDPANRFNYPQSIKPLPQVGESIDHPGLGDAIVYSLRH